MNTKFLKVALGIVLSATVWSASAQKTYTSGVITISSTGMGGQPLTLSDYFTADSGAVTFHAGPASIKVLSDAKMTFLAVLVDVPVASIKKAAIYTPDEIDQTLSSMPQFTFAPTADAKQISGFNCKRVVATNTKTNKTYDVWVTNDFSVPANAIVKYYAAAGGFPIQYTSFSQGQEVNATVTSIADTKAPTGTFSIASDYDKISLDDLKAMQGGH